MTDRTQALGTESIKHLLFVYAAPAVISQIIASLYNIVDRIFIGQGVGAMAIAGLAITLPIMNIIHAFGSLIGVGSSSRMSILLGRKEFEWAEKILGNSTVFTIALSGTVMVAAYLFLDTILRVFGASDDTISYAREYMLIVLPGMFLTTLSFNLTGLIRASGYPLKSMCILAGGALLNMILDPIFIFVLKWGIAGAAWATTLSMAVTSIASMIHFIQPQSFIRFKRHAWRPKGYIFKNITMIGMSPFSMNLAAAGVVALLNAQLIRYGGDLAVGTYGIVNTFGNFLVLFILGICQGMQPIAGYNYGARQNLRLKEVYLLTMKICVVVGFIGALGSCLFPETLTRAFTSDAELIEMARPAMRLLMCMFPLIGFTITNSNFFQSIDKPWIAIVTSLSRQVIFLAPLSLFMPWWFCQNQWNGLMGVWAACTTSDVIGAVLAAILLVSQRRIFDPNNQPTFRTRPEAQPD